MTLCNTRLTIVIPIQQLAPIIIGFPPVLISLMISVFNPIAAIAITIKNLLSSLNGVKKLVDTPQPTAIVVISDAPIKYRIKNGKILFNSTFFPSFPDFFVRKNANTNVMGIIASVLVNFTVTALSKVNDPRPHILSHVEAAAVTEDVSFIAVPAKIPNASPEIVEKPSIVPNGGNKIADALLVLHDQHLILDLHAYPPSSAAPRKSWHRLLFCFSR